MRVMLGIRLEGDLAEAWAFLDALRVIGFEVQPGRQKNRGGFSHVYGMVRLPGYPPGRADTIRAEATVDRRALPARQQAVRPRRRRR